MTLVNDNDLNLCINTFDGSSLPLTSVAFVTSRCVL